MIAGTLYGLSVGLLLATMGLEFTRRIRAGTASLLMGVSSLMMGFAALMDGAWFAAMVAAALTAWHLWQWWNSDDNDHRRRRLRRLVWWWGVLLVGLAKAS